MQKLLTLIAIFTTTLHAFSQGFVEGRIIDSQNSRPVEFANIVVRQAAGGAAVRSAHSDANGNYTLRTLPYGKYTLSATYLGYREKKVEFTLTQSQPRIRLDDIILAEDVRTLTEATVTGQRSEMKLEVDRKTFNVESQISAAGQTASEVLENIPSVEVDNDGNVSLRGNSSVEVWINGKQAGLTTDNQGDILQQLPAESIERIEVIDNPSAKFSAEGSAGIINIVLKKDLKPGYYGSLQAGGDTHGGANVSGNINYNSRLLDAYLNIGYRHRESLGGSQSEQKYYETGTYQRYDAENRNRGNNLFTRAGVTLHLTPADDLGVSGMFMFGGRHSDNVTPYHYGNISTAADTRIMTRRATDTSRMTMYNVELTYRHQFSDNHHLDVSLSHNRWHNNTDNLYQDSTQYLQPPAPTTFSYQRRPMTMDNRRWEAKLDYENQISKTLSLQAGYQANISRENSPQQSWTDPTRWDGSNAQEEKPFFNRFIYENHIHALYATLTLSLGRFGIMGGLRGEYWHVETESRDWDQEYASKPTADTFKKDYFQLFPSIFLSYQLTDNDQLQLNYTRRLRRPWGGQLNSFRDTRDATMVRFGNPLLTPEYTHSISLNYLRTWQDHSILLSAYYRPTTDVMQRINWQSSLDGIMYQSNFNVARSTSTGLEITAKNKIARIVDLSTNLNLYYYSLDSYTYHIDGQDVHGTGNHNFTWNVREQASFMLPWGITLQLTGRFRGRQAIAQGHRKASGSLDVGVRKSFLDKKITLSLNARDILNTRRFDSVTSSDTFWRHQKNWRNSRTFSATLTYSFGNTKPKKQQRRENSEEDIDTSGGYGDADI